ncbi:MAG: four helix bundle protein [Chitinophagales bacterium]|nr:four helix bundle protein [Chitinophagales bacterium]
MKFKFEKLVVWQQALDLSMQVHLITKKFPKDEMFVLSSQIKRAADSVSLNIAEGSTSQSNPEFSRFLSIALRSNIEVVACLHLAKSRKIIQDDDFNNIYHRCHQLLIKITALKTSLKRIPVNEPHLE